MARCLIAVAACALLLAPLAHPAAQRADPGRKAQGLSGNPVFDGWYADPEAIVYGTDYWVYPTWSDEYGPPEAAAAGAAPLTSRQKRAINPQYLKQTFLDAFSSKDLVDWQKHPRVLDVKDVAWAEFALWAPSAIRANGRYLPLLRRQRHPERPGRGRHRRGRGRPARGPVQGRAGQAAHQHVPQRRAAHRPVRVPR